MRGVAADVRAGESQRMLADEVDQQKPRLNLGLALLPLILIESIASMPSPSLFSMQCLLPGPF